MLMQQENRGRFTGGISPDVCRHERAAANMVTDRNFEHNVQIYK